MTEIEAFSRYRDSAGLTKKYASANRHYITLHSFRSYFFTRARRAHDTDIAHAMVGHTTYLGMYDRKDDLEKLELYLKVEPMLRIGFQCRAGENEEKAATKLSPRLRIANSYFNRIESVTEFKVSLSSKQCVILVTDRKRGHKPHDPPCRWLKAEYFIEKVIANQGKNGRYYWCSNSDYNQIQDQIERCTVCKRNRMKTLNEYC